MLSSYSSLRTSGIFYQESFPDSLHPMEIMSVFLKHLGNWPYDGRTEEMCCSVLPLRFQAMYELIKPQPYKLFIVFVL